MADRIELNPIEKLTQTQVKRMTAVHGWAGTILGLVLYVVIVSGTIVVFGHEISEWSSGGTRVHQELSDMSNLDGNVRAIAEHTSKGYLDRITMFTNSRGELAVFPHTQVMHPEDQRPKAYGSLYNLDPATGETIRRFDGFAFDDEESHHTSALEDFLVELHVALYVPNPWGSILTGIMGLLVMATAITGFLMHRHLFRDLFVAARRGERLVTTRDRHILAASWSLIFAFLLGFTGSFYSFAGTVTFPLVSKAAFGGDRQAMINTMFMPPTKIDTTPAPVANLDRMVAQSVERMGGSVRFVQILNWGRADGRMRIFHTPNDGGLAFGQTIFRTSDGKFLGEKPIVGSEPSLGADLYGLIHPLHFGDFAGVFSKSVWVGLGTAMAYVIISGLRLWVRRREDEALWQHFGRAVTITGFGLPLAMLASAWAYFPALAFGDPFFWTPIGFFAGAAAIILFGALSDAGRLIPRLLRLLSVGCLALPILRLGFGGTGWVDAADLNLGAVPALDMVFALIGVGLWFWASRTDAATTDRAGAAGNTGGIGHSTMEPAE